MREWIYGRNPVYETLRAGRRQAFRLIVAQGTHVKGRLGEILQIAQQKRILIEQVPRTRLDSIGDGHQGIALEAGVYPYCALQDIQTLAEERSEPPFVLILDALQDPQNLGTLLRTAEAVGLHGVLLPLRQTVTVTPAVVSASSGASEHLLIAQTNLAQAIKTLKDAGVWVVGLEGGPGAERVDRVRLDGALALVVGSEGQGMRSLTRDLCDLLVQLPMRGRVESLNAAVAGSIALYFSWQARKFTTG